MLKGCIWGLVALLVLIMIVIAVGYWAYSSLNLEKAGLADEPGILGFLGDEYKDKSARDLGIEKVTFKQLIDHWSELKKKIKQGASQTESAVLREASTTIGDTQ